MTLILIRTVLLYFLTLLAMKAMGKRQLGQLQPFELVIVLIVSEMATLAMQSNTASLLNSVVPILTITLLQILLSGLALKSERVRRLLCGQPLILIKNGCLLRENMAKLRVNLNDMQELCRAQGYFDLSGVDTAIMETNGQLSIYPKPDQRPLQTGDILKKAPQERPGELLVLDGRVNQRALSELGRDSAWLRRQLRRQGAPPPEELFVAGCDGQGHLFWQEGASQ